jgi:hypothetical protein
LTQPQKKVLLKRSRLSGGINYYCQIITIDLKAAALQSDVFKGLTICPRGSKEAKGIIFKEVTVVILTLITSVISYARSFCAHELI